MLNDAIKLWVNLTQPETFLRYQKIALSIFR
jgi:hypothetical protein